jgi:hypothetical protein
MRTTGAAATGAVARATANAETVNKTLMTLLSRPASSGMRLSLS